MVRLNATSRWGWLSELDDAGAQHSSGAHCCSSTISLNKLNKFGNVHVCNTLWQWPNYRDGIRHRKALERTFLAVLALLTFQL